MPDAIIGLLDVDARWIALHYRPQSALALTVELRKRGVPVRKGNVVTSRPEYRRYRRRSLPGFLTIYPARAPMLAAELDELAWDERAAERGQDKPHTLAPDHGADALRYHMHESPPAAPHNGNRYPKPALDSNHGPYHRTRTDQP